MCELWCCEDSGKDGMSEECLKAVSRVQCYSKYRSISCFYFRDVFVLLTAGCIFAGHGRACAD